MQPPTDRADDWIAITDTALPVDEVTRWVVRPDCGALVVFAGTVRDHAEGRSGVTHLDYEAYGEQAEARMRAVVAETRARWPALGRIAALHRTGRVELTEVSVVVGVSSGHRGDAFAAAHFAIDAIKATVPIWKRESWETGEGWGTGAHEVTDPTSVASP